MPTGSPTPEAPANFRKLTWVPPLLLIANVEATTHARMARKPRSRTLLIARCTSWVFGDPYNGITSALAEFGVTVLYGHFPGGPRFDAKLEGSPPPVPVPIIHKNLLE